jgi:hypothetical protein
MDMSRFASRQLVVGTAALLLLVGCGKGRSVLLVTVTDKAPESPITGIDRFVVTVMNASGKSAGPYVIEPATKPVTLPPDRQFSLGFDANVDGAITVAVQAIGGGQTVASGRATASVSPSHSARVTVPLTAGAVLPGMVALRSAGIVTSGPGAPGSGGLTLRDHGFEGGERVCSGKLCLRGEVSP